MATGLRFPPAPRSRNCSSPCSAGVGEDVSAAGLDATGALVVGPPELSNGVEQLYSLSCAWCGPHVPRLCRPKVHGWTMPKARIWLVSAHHLLHVHPGCPGPGRNPLLIPQPGATSPFTILKVHLGFFHLTLMPGRSLWLRNLRVSLLSCPCVVRWLQGQSPDLVNWCYCL